MKIVIHITGLMLLFLSSINVIAEGEESYNLEDEISGFTIDSTITRSGHDFARFLLGSAHMTFRSGGITLR